MLTPHATRQSGGFRLHQSRYSLAVLDFISPSAPRQFGGLDWISPSQSGGFRLHPPQDSLGFFDLNKILRQSGVFRLDQSQDSLAVTDLDKISRQLGGFDKSQARLFQTWTKSKDSLGF